MVSELWVELADLLHGGDWATFGDWKPGRPSGSAAW